FVLLDETQRLALAGRWIALVIGEGHFDLAALEARESGARHAFHVRMLTIDDFDRQLDRGFGLAAGTRSVTAARIERTDLHVLLGARARSKQRHQRRKQQTFHGSSSLRYILTRHAPRKRGIQ